MQQLLLGTFDFSLCSYQDRWRHGSVEKFALLCMRALPLLV